jgi:glycosyltransferase involved in cell wall biosynthesis
MRIAYLFNSSTPSSNPSSIQVVNTCGALAQLSNRVKLIVPSTGQNVSLSKFYGINKSPKLIKLKYFNKFPLGIYYYLFSFFSILYAIFDKTELYITRNIFNLILLNILKKRVIIEIHHDLHNEGRLVKFLCKYINVFNKKNIVKIVAITNAVKKYLVENFNIDSKKIEVISSASSLKFKFNKLKKKKFYNIGYFGSLDSSKGTNFIIKLAKKDKFNKYLIYGGSQYDVSRLKKRGIPNNLKINHSVHYGRLKPIISKMDILLMPSNTKKIRSIGKIGNIVKFTSPLKLFDYLASGKLIISSNVSVFKEILSDGKNCLVVNNFNINNWIKKINKAKFETSKINNIKRNAFELSKKYTYLKRAEKILDF